MNHEDIALGTIEIAPEVIETIAGIVASKIEGFVPVRGKFLQNVNHLFGIDTLNSGVILTESEAGYIIDVHGAVYYGYAVPKVALKLQEAIKEQLLFSCELVIEEVNVHIHYIIPAKSEETALELGEHE